MLAHLVAALVLLAAPEDDAAAKLRVAWASQYEWNEDGVRNITLDFDYTGNWVGRDNQEIGYRGKGQIVVANGELVRRHLPEASARQREQLEPELDWVIARFMRRKFDDEFKEARFGAPEDLAGDVVRIPVGDLAYLLKNDRFAGMERNVGTQEKPFPVRVEFTLGAIGGGYGILEEKCSYTRNMVKTMESRRLTLRKYGTPPAPQRYEFERANEAGRMHLTVVFSKLTVNAENPVVLDAAARDRLEKAWARQYRLPREIRIEGSFQRKLDRRLARARWTPNVKGKFQVWGLDSIEVVVKESQGGKRSQDTCLEHLRWAFSLFDVEPFDEEFRGCGFALEKAEKGEQGEKGAVTIRVFGHPDVLAYRIVDGVITGRLDTGTTQAWWQYELKELSDEIVLIERMTRETGSRKFELPFRYGKVGGHLVPRSVAVLGTANFGGRTPLPFGVAEYRLSRLKVSLPDK